MFHCVLYEPEIPPNTGNLIRLCANTGFTLHLIHPLGFELDNKRLKRAGLDYREWARVQEHASLQAFMDTLQPQRVFACSTRGQRTYSQATYQAGDVFLFGPETRGLPQAVLDTLPPEQVITIPMQANSRSLNLSNAAAIILFEAWRQQQFSI
ncbi:tRNA (uridine(34)/cytosine(34)/5-carboxymethylaminomethyluridine(34)-2'-O)-methyltransferase TrmL [Candidatus Venteria ishoeyi]|uniref:tRNA (cytidine(34)-2'-O)-methyltransferase n=1 Tax=Candidatus Venteria ishoeyi TaxID=1899563 RepID=A0A1H6FED5_9GAMM|nr:tRNA (uridine(34)/cytosine(34)/5-carboxymethylaminomethyluridine(34)-2'-O)-methyltransferase TrmL [Candidatus Venteria ishoeyi]MDM8546842.1 tRNA (uridine(34)/cytosine(34)/5-carboxymethylaminomethyluridine(34)-2'-O)-methyltransferase TrmL [Candidatus Venteria ishoeyi]SEH08432.1 tRNA (cytidine(34)-2'-O)-methyltransferase [Candidatus Venteria ishoeyi]